MANIYLHYVLDLWFQKTWRARTAQGDTIIVRYADDFVVGFQHKRDAKRFLSDLKDRLASFSLELHPDKTRLIEFGRFAEKSRRARGEGRPETFDFLGFTHYCLRTRDGWFGLGRKPVGQRVNRTVKRIGVELRRRMHHHPYEVVRWLGKVLNGWLRYYAVPTSYRSLKRFVFRLRRMWLRVLRRRSQMDRTKLDKLGRVANAFWPPLKILHPWPDERFRGQRPEVGAGWSSDHVRICTGGARQLAFLP